MSRLSGGIGVDCGSGDGAHCSAAAAGIMSSSFSSTCVENALRCLTLSVYTIGYLFVGEVVAQRKNACLMSTC